MNFQRKRRHCFTVKGVFISSTSPGRRKDCSALKVLKKLQSRLCFFHFFWCNPRFKKCVVAKNWFFFPPNQNSGLPLLTIRFGWFSASLLGSWKGPNISPLWPKYQRARLGGIFWVPCNWMFSLAISRVVHPRVFFLLPPTMAISDVAPFFSGFCHGKDMDMGTIFTVLKDVVWWEKSFGGFRKWRQTIPKNSGSRKLPPKTCTARRWKWGLSPKGKSSILF